MDFKPPKHNESSGTARNCRKMRCTRPWTTMAHQRRSLSLEPFKQRSKAVWTKRKIFSQFATLLGGQPQTLYERPLERKLDMRRRTTGTEERRMEDNYRRFSECNNIRKPKTHTDYREKSPGNVRG